MPSSSSSLSSTWGVASPTKNTATTTSIVLGSMSETHLSPALQAGMIPDSPKLFDEDIFMQDFPPTQIVDYYEIERCQEIYPSPSSKELVLYKPETQQLENMHETREEIVKDVVHREVDMLLTLANEEKRKLEHNNEQTSTKDVVNEPMNVVDELMILPAEKASVEHENSEITEKPSVVITKQNRPTCKRLAYISNVSFQIPEDFKVTNGTIDEFVPKDEVLMEINAMSNKKYSFSDRLRGWNMECRMRLHGIRQLDKYFTHVQSNTVMRSIPEIVRFVLYEIHPKQMKEANKKRKAVDLSDSANHENRRKISKNRCSRISSEGDDAFDYDENESYVHMFLRVARSNLVNGTAVEVPLITEWEEFKAAKKAAKEKARAEACEQEVGTSNMDSEAADVLIRLAEETNIEKKKAKSV